MIDSNETNEIPEDEIPVEALVEPEPEIGTEKTGESDSVEEAEEKDLVDIDYTPTDNVELKYPTSKPYKEGQKPAEIHESLALLKGRIEDIYQLISSRPSTAIGNDEKAERWLAAVSRGRPHLSVEDMFYDSVERKDGDWHQFVDYDNKELTIGRPKIDDIQPGEKLTGLAARIRMQTVLGVGSPVRVPLWHTGIWITINTPSDSAVMALAAQVSNDKIVLGRLTGGAVFSNTTVYTTRAIVDFILAHVVDATYRYSTPDELKSIIRTTDIPSMIWGVMSSMYPSGYPYQSPCIADPHKCNHVVEELLNLSRIHWVDNTRITSAQRKHMLRRSAKFTPEELDRYQSDFKFEDAALVQLNEKVKLQLSAPTIEDFEAIGIDWVNGVVRATEDAMGRRFENDDERNNEIARHAMASMGRQYGHWVKSISIENDDGSPNIVEDRDAILDAIDVLGTDRELLTKFFDAVKRYINTSTVAVVAVPRYDCPMCGQTSEEQTIHPHLIPIDLISGFFTVIFQRVSKVTT